MTIIFSAPEIKWENVEDSAVQKLACESGNLKTGRWMMELNSFVCLIADVATKIAYLYFISLRADTPLADIAGSLIHW